jgi:hypothetical protein
MGEEMNAKKSLSGAGNNLPDAPSIDYLLLQKEAIRESRPQRFQLS